MSELIRIAGLTFSYPGQTAKALDGVDLTVERGDFLVLCGPSGSGKSTLLRHCKSDLAPHGTKTGEIFFEGVPLEQVDRRLQSEKIGFVSQSPENQLVTDKVWHELAFGLESLGCGPVEIRRRVAETASFFGIQNWFTKNVIELSGGQKQLLNLAAVMVMQPSVLILDEPTSQLDPIAALDFLSALQRLNRELGTTVILSEHRLEDALPMARTAAVLDRGKVLCTGTPARVGELLKDRGHAMFAAMPAPMRIWAGVKTASACPVTVREGREWLADLAEQQPLGPLPAPPEHTYPQETVLEGKDIWYRYGKDSPDVVKGFSVSLRPGEFFALLGGNGTGKTTALKVLADVYRPYRGKVRRRGRTALLPQDPRSVFTKNTLREDLTAFLRDAGIPAGEGEKKLAELTALCRLDGLLDRHPFDLSGGEQQRAALAKVLLPDPDILLLDEPTKGIDAAFKQSLAAVLEDLLRQGKAILMTSHDVEFCAQYAHRCALFFDGSVAAEGTPREFFSGNSFYTTASNRMARELLPQAVTAEDVIAACAFSVTPAASPPPAALSKTDPPPPDQPTEEEEDQQDKPQKPNEAVLLTVKEDSYRGQPQKKAVVASALMLLMIPLTIYLGIKLPGSRKYYAVSLAILVECMAPFFLLFEGRKPKARELVTVASLCALGVAGRAAFFMIPQFKPVIAVAIVAGAAFGGETGFLVGAVSMLVSNMFYSQGPWTPWQMFAMGMVGFLAGLIFSGRRLQKSRIALCVYGALAAVLLYGGVMNFSSALTWSSQLTPGVVLTYFASGLSFDIAHGVSAFLFLWFGGKPLLEKLDRLKTKYGLLS